MPIDKLSGREKPAAEDQIAAFEKSEESRCRRLPKFLKSYPRERGFLVDGHSRLSSSTGMIRFAPLCSCSIS